jgi:hypothetical protein
MCFFKKSFLLEHIYWMLTMKMLEIGSPFYCRHLGSSPDQLYCTIALMRKLKDFETFNT